MYQDEIIKLRKQVADLNRRLSSLILQGDIMADQDGTMAKVDVTTGSGNVPLTLRCVSTDSDGYNRTRKKGDQVLVFNLFDNLETAFIWGVVPTKASLKPDNVLFESGAVKLSEKDGKLTITGDTDFTGDTNIGGELNAKEICSENGVTGVKIVASGVDVTTHVHANGGSGGPIPSELPKEPKP